MNRRSERGAPVPARRRPGRIGSSAFVLAALAVALAAAPARAQQRVPPPIQLVVPADTILLAPERFAVVVHAAAGTRLVATVAPVAAAAEPAWSSDTIQMMGARARIAWDLRRADGGWIAPGRYRLRVTALDSVDAESSAASVLDIARLAADTVPLPAPPGPRELLPETVQVRQTSPWAILIGAAAGLLPQLVGRHELNANLSGDPKAWIVVGSVTAVGFLAIFTGHRPAFSPENAQSNAASMEDFRGRLARAAEENARARAAAGFRIRSGAAP